MDTRETLLVLKASDLTPFGRRLVDKALASNEEDKDFHFKVDRFMDWWSSTYSNPKSYARLRVCMRTWTRNLIAMLRADYIGSVLEANQLLQDMSLMVKGSPPHLKLVQQPLEQLDLNVSHVETRLQRLAGKSHLRTIDQLLDSERRDLLKEDTYLLEKLFKQGAIGSREHEEILHAMNPPQPSQSSWWNWMR